MSYTHSRNSPFLCSLCGNEYDDAEFKPCKGLCSHSICLPCHRTLISKKCPICKREDAFLDRRIDYSSIDMLQKFRERFASEEANIHYCSECEEDSYFDKLRICVTCNPDTISAIPSSKSYYFTIEKEIAKKLAICSWCAIEQHREHGHKVVKFKDVKEEISVVSKNTKRKADDGYLSFDKKTRLEVEMMECG